MFIIGVIMSTTIKVRKETARKLTKLLGEFISKHEKKLSYDDLINYLIDIATKEGVKLKNNQKKLSDAARKILKIMENPIKGAGPEDFIEYGYDDIEG